MFVWFFPYYRPECFRAVSQSSPDPLSCRRRGSMFENVSAIWGLVVPSLLDTSSTQAPLPTGGYQVPAGYPTEMLQAVTIVTTSYIRFLHSTKRYLDVDNVDSFLSSPVGLDWSNNFLRLPSKTGWIMMNHIEHSTNPIPELQTWHFLSINWNSPWHICHQ